MLFRLHFLLYCIFVSYNQCLFSFLHFIPCRMCVCHMFNKVLTYLLTSNERINVIERRYFCFMYQAVTAIQRTYLNAGMYFVGCLLHPGRH